MAKTAAKREANKRRKKRLARAGTFTEEEFLQVFNLYGQCCAYCRKPLTREECTIDHVIPISRGGSNTINNLVPACKSCNTRKSSSTNLDKWLPKMI